MRAYGWSSLRFQQNLGLYLIIQQLKCDLMQSEIVKPPKMSQSQGQQHLNLKVIQKTTQPMTLQTEVQCPFAASYGSKINQATLSQLISHEESHALLFRYQQYLQYKMKRIFLVKQILLDIIKIYESLVPQTHLRVQDIQLLIFLLDTIEYLNNYSLIKDFSLEVQPYPPHLQLNLPDVVIKPHKLTSIHQSKMEQLKEHYFKKIDLINQKFVESIEKRTNILLQQFTGESNFENLQNIIEEIASLVFPKTESIKEVYYLYLEAIKGRVKADARATLSREELTLFYLWEHLIRFHSFEEDSRYCEEDYLQVVRNNLFCSSREHMIDHLFKAPSYATVGARNNDLDWK